MKRIGCPDLDPNWPGPDGKPRGPVLCVTYPNCSCGEEDRKAEHNTKLPHPPERHAMTDPLVIAAQAAFAMYERGHITKERLVAVLEDCVNARAVENGYAEKFGLPFPAARTKGTP